MIRVGSKTIILPAGVGIGELTGLRISGETVERISITAADLPRRIGFLPEGLKCLNVRGPEVTEPRWPEWDEYGLSVSLQGVAADTISHLADLGRTVKRLYIYGSESSFCSEAVLNQLGITGQDEQLCLQTVEGTGKPQASTRVKLELSSVAPGETRRIIVPEAWSVPSLDISMPNVCKKQREKWRHIKDLDIPQCSHGQVELLLGANVSEAVIQQEVRVALPTPSKFSSWTKYKRTVAWILRFLHNSKLKGEQKRQRNLGPLTVSELNDAEKAILQMVQAEAYRTELQQLQAAWGHLPSKHADVGPTSGRGSARRRPNVGSTSARHRLDVGYARMFRRPAEV
ncbi:hypothetical protein FJT64_022472 [Amphibalanus amphitrite]|uniref:Uncharacterized protein n=1 Tax=Amphibalanus amphitrite TaxID=1232801 RepID=A0A6A4WL75_AMPAM|nr:hypothetical protein FJT64_022472 [Amphibalanus amphitrite]